MPTALVGVNRNDCPVICDAKIAHAYHLNLLGTIPSIQPLQDPEDFELTTVGLDATAIQRLLGHGSMLRSYAFPPTENWIPKPTGNQI